ncbi:hypothetical protein [Tenacibaculum finnmarkense]|uniref:hypothetical protein n=1 Tax=Tenacibaculum finnmarkense TaxID=2781243 RepID=UPI001EFBF531|nr:hypothetical protein [Tenacibaculum finnmarkense]MCG8796333.1 hypothetical protein [Tenacibaculum finnmarkense]MCG8798663.1 hypothetical protein [Tenacibaculum finnmarkense]
MNSVTISDGKMTAIISHFWIIGTIIAFILNINTKNIFASFYTKQMLGIHLLSFLNGLIIFKYLGGFAGYAVSILLFVSWIISFMAAIKGERKLIPFLGDQFQDWFKGI